MASNETVPQLPNPFTPMAFLPPTLAVEISMSTYLIVGTAAVLVWDTLNNVAEDFRLLFNHRLSLPTLAYFASRVASLAYVLIVSIYNTSPIGNCTQMHEVIDGFFAVAVATTSLVFFFRVRAVYSTNKYVVGFFSILWLAVVGTCITVTRGVTGSNIGPTNYCVSSGLKSYVSSAGIVPLINDTLIFFAISYRLMRNTHVEYNLNTGARTFFFGDYLPAFSKRFFHDGQIYYVTTVIMNMLTVIMLYIHSAPITYRTMLTIPNVALTNMMACRIFRTTKLGIRDANTSFFGTTSKSNTSRGTDGPGPNAIPLAFRRGQDTTSDKMYGIDVIKTVEHNYDGENQPSKRDIMDRNTS